MAEAKAKKVKEVEVLTHKNTLVNKMLTVDLKTRKRSEVINTFNESVKHLIHKKEYDVLIEVIKIMKEYEA